VKTARTSVRFVGGTRGGVDREYKSGVKEYVQSRLTSDVVIAIRPVGEDSYELFFVPTILIEELGQKSISLRKIQALKNNYKMLERCKDYNYVIARCRAYGIISD